MTFAPNEVCKNLARQRVDETWNQLKALFHPAESDQVVWFSQARYAAGLSCHIAQRSLFPLFWRIKLKSDRPDQLLIAKLLENHLVFLVYLQKAMRCLEMPSIAIRKGQWVNNCFFILFDVRLQRTKESFISFRNKGLLKVWQICTATQLPSARSREVAQTKAWWVVSVVNVTCSKWWRWFSRVLPYS